MDVTALSTLMEVLDQRQEAAERKRGEVYDREDRNQRSTPSTRRNRHGAPLAWVQKMTMEDDPEGYLVTFEQLATATSWTREYWASRLGSCLIGEAQAAYQEAVRKLRPANEVPMSVSSRTDSGVDVLCNSTHVDIQRKSDKPPFTERLLVDALNYHLKPEPISILKAYRVADNFHARYRALSKTYVYRLITGTRHYSQLPVFERSLCWAVHEDHFSVTALQEAAKLLLGTHDFSTFRSLNSERPFKSPIKTLLQAEVYSRAGSFSQHPFHR
ncbi:tRNA pseudouridine synthase-like 1 [Polyodon spathula]|uniref:tRNA pseudouridine synthase-like 1 n=1 Tax=Polyodon spathula TaxID=7913 RepID=UPI001B7E2F3B|nr:tRNA pseudouridine synthase-like 1 [Polyodon spathula]